MKTFTNTKEIIKRVKYLLSTVNISLSLAKVIKQKELYKLLKKAQKINSKFKMSKSELKQFAKNITNMEFDSKKETIITKVFNIEIKEETQKEEKFEFIPFSKPFIQFFQDEFPLLLI